MSKDAPPTFYKSPPPSYTSPDPPAYSSRISLSRFSSKDEKKVSESSPQINPETHLPATFRVGTQFIQPLVAVPDLVDHLTFLACLDKLQRVVRETPTPDAEPDKQIPGDIKWAAFCDRASQRFRAWATSEAVVSVRGTIQMKDGSMQASVSQIEAVLATVDIDILMAWHTYMLNPGAYEQDLDRLSQLCGLKALGPFPLSMIVQNINLSSLTYRGSDTQALVVLTEANTVSLPCPRCQTYIAIPLIGHPTAAGGSGGLATPTFTHECPNCQLAVTRSALRAGRFLRDLADLQLPNPRTEYLAGLYKIDGATSIACKYKARERISKALSLAAWWVVAPQSYQDTYVKPNAADVLKRIKQPMDIVAFGDEFGWSQGRVREAVTKVMRDNTLLQSVWDDRLLSWTSMGHRRNLTAALQRVNRVYNAGLGGFTSIDLGPAIQRQAGFVTSMSEIGWLDMARWHGDSPNKFYHLQKAAARYHAFLDLMRAHEFHMLSPTLDIDLAWHTHQLHGAAYGASTRRVVGRFIDHDDAIVDVILKNAYDITATLWAERFHTAYSGCGCPVPPKAAAKLEQIQKRSRRPSFLQFKSKGPAAIAGTMSNIAAMSAEDATVEERAAECPSTHNRMQVAARGTSRDADPSLVKDYGPDHPSPFVKRLGQGDGKGKRDRERADTSAANAYPYWGVAMIGPWGPYPIGAGVGVGVGVGIGVGIGVSGSVGAEGDEHEGGASNGNCATACATGLDASSACGSGSCDAASGGKCGAGGGMTCGIGGVGCVGSYAMGPGGSAICGGGGGAVCGGGGGT